MMKTTYFRLLSLAALMLLFPVVHAQTVNPEKYSLQKGVGFTKYVNPIPNENGEYTLRLETFITGDVSASAIPTDFVLVLDASGSMEYDYRPENLYPPMNDEANSATWDKLKDYVVQGEPDDKFSRLSIYYTYKNGSVGSNGSGSGPSASPELDKRKGTRSNYTHFTDEGKNTNCSLLYHYEDGTGNDGYYKIFRRMFDAADGCLLDGNADPGADGTTSSSHPWKKYASSEHTGTPVNLDARPASVLYNLAIRLKDGTYKYLNGNGLSDDRYDATKTNTIMFVNDGHLYRLQRRREALVDGVEGFVHLIAAENAKDQWAENVTKHQVAIVRFSGNYPSGGASIEPPTGYSINSHVLKPFVEVGSADAYIADFEDKYIVSGSTYTDYGMNLAKMLLEDLQTKDGGKYAALNASGGVNRNKVVVFFTDGEPSSSTHGGGSSDSFFGTVTPSLRYGKTVKEVGVGKINGKIYTIDLAMTNSTQTFLRHLSSNYPKGDAKVTSGGFNATNFTGSVVPISETDETFTATEYAFLKNDEPIFYKDSNDGDLTSVFSGIASANTGDMAGSQLVVMDVMSDSFEVPSNVSGKIKFYTAQCIGTKVIDGATYLAFAQEVETPARPKLEHFWSSHTEGEGAGATTVWEDLGDPDGWDIDNGITYSTSSDGKSITVGGFDYVTYWCGKDDVIWHNNTRQIESDDPNYDCQVDGYRGFKLIIEFPIVLTDIAIGGPLVETNDKVQSGIYYAGSNGTAQGNPIITYEPPTLSIPVRLEIQKAGLKPGESASLTIQSRDLAEGSEWTDYTTVIVTGTSGTANPSVKLFNLDPSRYYRVKENGWSWNYSNPAQVESTYPSTENAVTNPLVITNEYQDKAIKHAEAKAVNKLKTTSSGTVTVYDQN